MNFLELFSPVEKGDFGLTEEAAYKSIELGNNLIPLWGGNQSHSKAERFVDEEARTKKNSPITIFQGEGIIISLDGSSGNMTYKGTAERFALNHHAGFFKVLSNSSHLVDAHFFSLFYQEQFIKESTSEGSKTLTLEKVYSMDFSLPPKDEQLRIMKKLHALSDRITKLDLAVSKINDLKQKTLVHSYRHYQGQNIPVKEALSCLSGNSGLTEDEVYQKILVSDERYRILSGATSTSNDMGFIPQIFLNKKRIKVFKNREGVLVIRKGKAGHTRYLIPDDYTLTDDAYILYSKENSKYKLSMKWFLIQYKNVFFDYASSSDNGTWNMTGFFKNEKIDIPMFEEQIEMVKKFETIDQAKDNILILKSKFDSLFTKSLAI